MMLQKPVLEEKMYKGAAPMHIGKIPGLETPKDSGTGGSEPLDCPPTLLLVSPGHSSFGLSLCVNSSFNMSHILYLAFVCLSLLSQR